MPPAMMGSDYVHRLDRKLELACFDARL